MGFDIHSVSQIRSLIRRQALIMLREAFFLTVWMLVEGGQVPGQREHARSFPHSNMGYCSSNIRRYAVDTSSTFLRVPEDTQRIIPSPN